MTAPVAAPGETEPRDLPRWLEVGGAWSWRLVPLGAVLYFTLELAKHLMIVVVPLFTAVLLCALLTPLTRLLRKLHLGRRSSAGLALFIAFAVLGGVGTYAVNRTIAEYPTFVDQVQDLVSKTEHWLTTGPLKLDPKSTKNIGGQITSYLSAHESQVSSGVFNAVGKIAEVATGAILTLFLTFFALADGEGAWHRLVGRMREERQTRALAAGAEVWRALTGYVGGTFVVALFHSVVLGVALAVTGVPLVIPLAMLIFIGSFAPIVGVIIFGGLAVLIALVSKGVGVGLAILIVLIVSNQIESHGLQPFIVGRYVHLHPVAIALSLTTGAIVAGIVGAIFAVPLVAAATAALRGARNARVDRPEAIAPGA